MVAWGGGTNGNGDYKKAGDSVSKKVRSVNQLRPKTKALGWGRGTHKKWKRGVEGNKDCWAGTLLSQKREAGIQVWVWRKPQEIYLARGSSHYLDLM